MNEDQHRGIIEVVVEQIDSDTTNQPSDLPDGTNVLFPSHHQVDETDNNKDISTFTITCQACTANQTFTEVSKFIEHQTIHKSAVGKYQCLFCETGFMHSISLQTHYLRKHRISLPSHCKDDPRPCRRKTLPKRFKEAKEDTKAKRKKVKSVKNVEKEKSYDEEEAQVPFMLLPEQLEDKSLRQALAADNTSSTYAFNNTSVITSLLTKPNSEFKLTKAMLMGDEVKGHEVPPQEGTTASDTPDITEDFHFILHTEIVDGSAFQFGKQYLKCLHCDYKTISKQEMCDHMLGCHRKLLKVNQSMQVNTDNSNDTEHVVSMSVYSEICGDSPNNEGGRKRKRKREMQDVPGEFSCDQCNKVFSRLRYLRKHQGTHRQDRRFICDTCGKGFKTKANLTLHRKIHNTKMFHCNQCDFESNINAAIHAHRQLHNQGCVLCDICGYAYSDKSTLAKHKQVHDVSRPFACTFDDCTWRFKTEVMCKAHVRAHTTEGKFRCTECGYVFRHKHHLVRHESKIHGIEQPKAIETMDPEQDNNQVHLDPNDQIVNAVDEAADTQVDDVDGLTSVEQLHLNSMPQYPQLVVTTDNQGTPITYEAADLQSMNIQALLQEGETTRAILLPTHFCDENNVTSIVFQQEELKSPAI